jgi:hypothetical protein
MTTPVETTGSSPIAAAKSTAWDRETGYLELARRSVLPVFESLAGGARDTDALLSVAFSPLVHAYLDHHLIGGSTGLARFLRHLTLPPHPRAATRFVEPGIAWRALDAVTPCEPAVGFDLRPGGGPEFEFLPYVPLVDAGGQVPNLYRELLPLTVAVLEGWGATVLVIHRVVPDPGEAESTVAEAQAQWVSLIHAPSHHRRRQ